MSIRLVVVIAGALAAARCNQVPLLAPTNSTITLTAASRVLATGGTTELTAFVVEQSGTPVQDGTFVRFSTSLGTVSPVEAQTRNGFATATFSAGNSSGIAEVRATSGSAGGGTSTTNVIQISIGAAAINTITLRASPGSVGPTGGTVELIASVVGENGRALENIPVTFNVDQGRLSAQTVSTNSSGEARSTLTTTQQTVANATAGTKTSSNVTITVRSGPGLTLSCTPTSGTGNCSAVQASSSTNTATVLFTVGRASSSSALSNANLRFGDGGSASLGNLAGGSATVTHTYNGPPSQTPVTYTATAEATDINGETTSISTIVSVTARTLPTPMNVTLTATEGTKTKTSARWTFSASVTGGGEGGTGNATIKQYKWDFGDGKQVVTSGSSTSHIYEESGKKTVVVTVEATDGREASAREEIIVAFSS